MGPVGLPQGTPAASRPALVPSTPQALLVCEHPHKRTTAQALSPVGLQPTPTHLPSTSLESLPLLPQPHLLAFFHFKCSCGAQGLGGSLPWPC